MKIKLIKDIPVNPENHLTTGRILDAETNTCRTGRGSPLWYVTGDTGEKIGILSVEAVTVIETETTE